MDTADSSPASSASPGATRVIVASTVMLTFISFWYAAAVVLADLGSSAFYVPGIAEQAIGKSAAWMVLAVMLFSYAVRALYIESSTMFVRGGVYRVVKEALGPLLAKLAVSALMFDFLVTGPISAVSAGQYLGGLLHDVAARGGYALLASDRAVNHFAAAFGVLVTLYFWWYNIKGIHESSQKAMRVMQLTTVMVVILIVWALLTLWRHPAPLPPLPTTQNLHFPRESLGWLWGSGVQSVAALALLIAFGHSILAMSGEETLAQVYREIESPKVRNLQRTGLVIFLYSIVFTAGAAFLGEMIIPDAVRRKALLGNLLGVLTNYLAGPELLKLLFQGFVVVVGVVMLAGAVNTAIIGSNGVLNRVAEDGVMPDWFRNPQRRYGTTYRMINLIVGLQIGIIAFSAGNIYALGEAYAFGLVWSFCFLAISVFVLRFKQPDGRAWKVPLNLRLGGREIPVGLGLIAAVLAAVAVMNLFTKQIATIYGTAFTAAFFVLFVYSERANKRRKQAGQELDKFLVQSGEDLRAEVVQCRPGSVLVAVHDYAHLGHLRRVLERTNTGRQDVVAVTVRIVDAGYGGSATVSEYEQLLFTAVVAVAERAGKPVSLLVVPGTNVFDALVQTAARLRSPTLVAGRSRSLAVREQGTYTGLAWEHLGEPRPPLRLEVSDGAELDEVFFLGPHEPRLRDKDVALMHDIWLGLIQDPNYRGLHHHHVVSLALKRLREDLEGPERESVLQGFGGRKGSEDTAHGAAPEAAAGPLRE